MATIVNDLCVIKVFWEGNTWTIKAEKAKWTDKQSIETTYASDSHDPAQVHFGKCEYSIDLNHTLQSTVTIMVKLLRTVTLKECSWKKLVKKIRIRSMLSLLL